MGSKRILDPVQKWSMEHANDDESLKKCWNLERILEAEQFGAVKKADLRMDQLLGEFEEDD